MAQVIVKRTFDSFRYDIDCTNLLADTEIIAGSIALICEPPGLSFGTPIVNIAPVTFEDGTQAAAGKVIQVQISGGKIPTAQQSILHTIRAQFATSLSPNRCEATVLLEINDTPE